MALWTALIFAFSGESFSADATGGWLAWLLERIAPDLDADARYRLHLAVRKGAHVFEYAVLGALAFHAARVGAPREHRLRPAGLALALVAAVAVADESHQARLAQRTGSPRDVALDLAGGAAGLGLAAALRLALGRRGSRVPSASPRPAPTQRRP